MMIPAAGILLLASPQLTDPNFLHSVVYLLDHGNNGTFGFIINRPLELPLREVWSEVPAALAQTCLAADGGPVDRHRGLLLHRCESLKGAQVMSAGICIGGELGALATQYAHGSDGSGPRLFLGHSAWAPGQLQNELEEGAWLMRPGTADLLLNPQPRPMLWQQLFEGRHGGPPDPSHN
jgi:putative transcriptional regulator